MIVTIDTANETALNWSAKGTERKVQNVLNILRTYKGEVAYNRSFGVSADIIDKPIDEMRAILSEDLFSAIEANVSGVRLVSIDIRVSQNKDDIEIKVDIEV